MSRFFRYGELPLVLLALIEQEPLNGYELMGELERLFGPAYQPSAGSVYPALQRLEAEDLITPTGDEVPKRYVLTKIGNASIADRRHKLAEIERRTGSVPASAGRHRVGSRTARPVGEGSVRTCRP